ncbi:hypothetical protein FB45DRAFT_911320 [Roridomyces roridus]|uniref:AB hydrolase-1 domain-containing protein n=1 Tax=Roridomyces roridus TaxID=1738132 RepID=A0AAD7FRS0_9AGAR|nr:hypothetical protein FB45DRAFT_911320 [Roridomyces roridus]
MSQPIVSLVVRVAPSDGATATKMSLSHSRTSFAGSLPKIPFCGEIDVRMAHTRPFDYATNNITVWFAMNRPRDPAGLLLYHAGGPGLDAASEAWFTALNISSDSAPFNLLQDFDLLAMNTRGLQFSNPLNCSFNTFFNNITFAFPSTEAEFDQYHAAMSKLFSSCGKNSTPKGIMNHTGTFEVVQDWDSIRAALGYEKVHFAGVSYGTFVSMEYVARFPERVGNFVLDAVIPHGAPFQDMITDQVGAINRLLLRADAFCLTDPTCPFHGQGNGSVVAAWDTLLARALKAPIPAASCGEGKGCNTPVTPTDLRLGVSVIFRANPDFPLFNIALNDLFAYQQQGDIRESIVTPLLCADFQVSGDLRTWEGFHNLSVNSQINDPHKIVYSQMWQIALMCGAWPFTVPAPSTISTELPLMLITSDFDLNLPTELTTFAWELTLKAVLVVRHGDDHTSILFPPPITPVQSIAVDFIRTGVLLGASSNEQVTVYPPGSTRGPIPGAYDVPTGSVAEDTSSIEEIQ